MNDYVEWNGFKWWRTREIAMGHVEQANGYRVARWVGTEDRTFMEWRF